MTTRVVALGGGHGLAASLGALRRITDDLTAVVTVADDGGSSGRLRAELDALPPGDLRMALVALAGTDPRSTTWARLLQHRYGGSGALAQHAVGNLLITGLCQTLGDPVAALGAVAELVGCRGRVLPLSTDPMNLVAEVAGLDRTSPERLRLVQGQVQIATTPGRVVSVAPIPSEPAACAAAVAAVLDAEWVVFGPGSWFTSVLPHLLVPELAKALAATGARRLLVLNLVAQHGETTGFSPADHLRAFAAHCGEIPVDLVLADSDIAAGSVTLAAAAEAMGARLVLAPVARGDGTARHDLDRLAAAYREIFTIPPPAPNGEPAWR